MPDLDTNEAVFKGRLSALAAKLRRAADSLEALKENPEPDPRHFQTEAVRQAAQIRNDCAREADQLAYLAYAAPDKVSINKLAQMLGVSVNTLRVKLPQVQQGKPRDDDGPF